MEEKLRNYFLTNKEELNQKFHQVRYQYPSIDSLSFFENLRKLTYPLLEKMDGKKEEKVNKFIGVIYDKTLEFTGKKIIGENNKYPNFENNISKVLTQSVDYLLEYPDEYISTVSNSLIRIYSEYPDKLEEWISIILRLTSINPTLTDFLKASFIYAWILGFPKCREMAIEYCLEIPENIFELIFDFKLLDKDKSKFKKYLIDNPWNNPKEFYNKKFNYNKMIVKSFGGFKGNDGYFISPPAVMTNDGKFLLWDGKDVYWLHVDCFGITLDKTDMEPSSDKDLNTKNFKLIQNTLWYKDNQISLVDFPMYLPSIIQNEKIAIVTSPYTHLILIAGAPEQVIGD